ncbi:Prenylcysteine lyase-domain-containing protein [Aspergillus ambiguus]|uniref:putative prenylcysteine lyase n=1 Tax=Aspergillus ambiguus TaxID=176160 RepID=UPI003CCD0B80
MTKWLLSALALCFSLTYASHDLPAKQVAIIGAGAAGSSTAYSLRNAINDATPLNITVFERAPYVGGRSTTVNVLDNPAYPVELGASIFVNVNYNLVNATRDLGLSVQSASYERPKESPDQIGVWDGEQFVFVLQDTYSWWNVAKLIWRYGWAPVRTQSLMKRTVQSFLRLYDAPLFPFASLSAAAEAIGLLDATAAPGQSFLSDNGVAADFARDVIQASTRVNYGQNLPLIHGLEAMVCMATDGAMAVSGGNWQIFDRMLRASRADVHLNHTVTAIRRSAADDDDSWIVAVDTPSGRASYVFDEVVIAGPLQYTDIQITPGLAQPPDEIPFVTLHVTLFASPHRLSPQYFHTTQPVPETVLTTLPRDTDLGSSKKGVGPAGFWSISTLRTVDMVMDDGRVEQQYVYKIFSPERVTASFVRDILGLNSTAASDAAAIGDLPTHDISWSHEKTWRPYPFLYPRVTFEEPVLAPGLWYTGGIESFISTMETSALMGKNIAALMAQSWPGQDEVSLGDDPVDRTEL